jgi:spermidine synthase
VLCIALGSFAVSALPRIPKLLLVANLWGLFALLCLLHLLLEDAPYWTHVLRSLFRTQATAFYPYHLAAFLCVLAVIGLPVALSGATLPLIFHQLRRETGELGDVAGRLYSWNTLGSLLGALLGGYALLFWLDLHQVFRVATAALAVGAALVTLRIGIARRRTAAGLLFAAGLAAIAALPTWSAEHLSSGLFRAREARPDTFAGPDTFFASTPSGKLLFYDDGPTASVAVKHTVGKDGRVHRSIFTNGKSDGAIWGDYATMGLAALLPALLAEQAERAFVVGYGTGVTAGEFAALRSARAVDVAEISSAVIRARSFFDYGNQRASENAKVHILGGDAYRTLLRSDGRYDVIASEPSNPWVTGVEMLYSRDFLEAARHHLTPGGVYAQWFHTYETDAASTAMVLRTYAAVFEQVAVWYGKGNDLLLLGLRDPKTALDLDRLEARAAQPDFAAGLRRCGIGGLPELLAHELLPLGVVHATPLPGELHTLLRPRLSYLAARAFFTGDRATLPRTAGLEAARRGFRNSLVQRYAARNGGRLPEATRARLVRETCRHRPDECATLLAQWTHEVPESSERRRVQREIRADPTQATSPLLQLPRQLAPLYGGKAPATAETSAVQVASQALALFSRYYHHAAPFSRRALAETLRRCQTVPDLRQRCAELREQAEQTLGDLEVELGWADQTVDSGGA